MIRIACIDLGDQTRDAPWRHLLPVPGLAFDEITAAASGATGSLDPGLLWVHGPPDAAAPAEADVRIWFEDADTPILLTGAAVLLPARLGLESTPPAVIDRPWRDADDDLFLHGGFAETPRVRGHAAFRRHRLFDGLGSGTFTWWPRDGERFRAWTYTRPDWPSRGRVLAVERAFIHINPDRATVWEYERAAGRPHVLCIGAYLPLPSGDPVCRPHVERFTHNALRYLAGAIPADRPDLHWAPADTRCVRDPALPLPQRPDPAPASGTESARPLPLEIAPLRLAADGAAAPFTLAGRRALVAGHEDRGIGEVWVHPLRVVQDLRLPDATCEAVTITGLGAERRIRVDGARLSERIHVPAELPAVILEYERPLDDSASDAAVSLTLEWTTDLRLMWPYPADVMGPLHWNVGEHGLVIRSGRTGETVCFQAALVPAGSPGREGSKLPATSPIRLTAAPASAAPDADRARLRCVMAARLDPGRRLRLLVAAGVAQGDDPAATLRALWNPAALVLARAASLHRLQRERLSVNAPDPRIGQAVEWAKLRLDGYRVDTPDVGRSLVAGYWTSRPGWNDGRPGYAWYFGRDAAWTALASLACGDFDAARDVIAFLGRHQDLTGKILHECTTSGAVHYDAADATPLYLLLVARYLAWTGDDGFVRAQWTHVRRAFAFCLGTDTDGDGLIENARVGHGWIEFGRLGGGKVTYYNAGIWTAALRELAIAADSIGEARFAAELQTRAKAARLALEDVFFDPDARRYALKASDAPGGWARDFTPTATHAVPLLLGVADADRAGSWLDAVASEGFTTDWGVRLISSDEPDFDPGRYHGGAVWPLFTGWVSWAEYAAGRSAAAFRHWRANLDLPFERALGAWDEVLHGAERRAAGVCPDQAWSTAMAIAPLVYGLLGVEPDAPKGRLRLRPRIPDEWDRLEVRNIRMGDASVRLRYLRNGATHTFEVEQDEGAMPLRLVFEPAVGGPLVGARVDGEPAHLEPQPFGDRFVVPVQLVLDHERVVELEVGRPG